MNSIVIASDHAGFALKQQVINYLNSNGYNIEDLGCHDEQSVDYPDYGKKAAQAVVANAGQGVIICGSGIGISIAANRIKGARAALCVTPQMAQLARQHNNANILALSGRLVDEATNLKILEQFLTTDFEGGRHQKRVEKLDF